MGDVVEYYLAGWIKFYQAGFQHWWGRMDDDSKQRYVELARTKYWAEIERRRMSIIVAKNKPA